MTDVTDLVLTEQRGRVLLITINRPEARNALNAAVVTALRAAFDRLDEDGGLTVGVLTGAGPGFSAGMDLKEFARGGEGSTLGELLRLGMRKPVVAAVEGFALAGGLELALTCDLLVASEGAKLGIPEVNVGLFAAGGALFRLLSRVGYSVTMELALTGEPITAEAGAALGLVSRVTEKGKALDGALELAQRIAKNAPLGVTASKDVLKAAQGLIEDELWPVQKALGHDVFKSADAKEGPKAFIEKRPPNWSGA
ncbi:MAG TPA: crotonase/enoyl-CoA hydratase family protein [Acidimicrobiales bacterium]|jgi:enoyl-CoA hydratase|nr:crotonase/enoyl-CoA hydratase family protein [Acidimicrobiales bacterium]